MVEIMQAVDTVAESPTMLLKEVESNESILYSCPNSDEEAGGETSIGKVSSIEEGGESLDNLINDDKEENGKVLSAAKRIQILKEKTDKLKEVLKEEWQLWKEESKMMDERIKESERLKLMNEKTDRNILMATVQRLRLTDSDYSIKNSEISRYRQPAKSSASLSTMSDSAYKDASFLDYEKRLARKHASIARSHFEQRYKVQQQIAADSYKQRLLEVEKLCEEELVKMKETHERLEPLNKMASDWSIPDARQKLEMSYQNNQLSHKAELQIKSRESKGICSVKMAAKIEIPLQTQFWYGDDVGQDLQPYYCDQTDYFDNFIEPTDNNINALVTSQSMFDTLLETKQ